MVRMPLAVYNYAIDPATKSRALTLFECLLTVLERLCSLVMSADSKAKRVCAPKQEAPPRNGTRTKAGSAASEVGTLMAVHQTLRNRGLEVTFNQVNDALGRLVDLRNILQRTFSRYEFAVTAFPEMIAQTARLDDLIALNSQTYQHYGDVVSYSK